MGKEERFKAALGNPEINGDKIFSLIHADPTLIDAVFRELSSRVPRVKFGCAKSLLLVSEHDPFLLMSKLDDILKLLGSENQILKWTAIAAIGNLAAADRENRIRPILPKLYNFLSSGELITANHAIATLGKIARILPKERRKITATLLSIEHADFGTAECRNIAIGKVILALDEFLEPASVPDEAIDFARRQTANTRKATAAKAESFLRKHGRSQTAAAARA